MKKLNFNLVSCIALLFLLLFTQMGLATEKPLRIAFRGDAATLDPHGRNENTTFNIQAHIFDRLVKFDKNGKIIMDLAESWRLIDDVTLEFKLKKGIKFHNGEAFNAEAAKYSLERAKTWKKSQWKYMVPNYKEIKVIDDYTLQLITKVPEPEAIQMLVGINMVPPVYYSQTPETKLAKSPIGSGAYKFVEWVKDDHIKLVANPDWHEGKVEFKQLVFRSIPEGATRVAALVSGEVDVIWGVSIPDISRIERNKNTYVSRVPSKRSIYIMFDIHTKKGGPAPEMQPGLPEGAPNPFRDIRVRKAVAHAINIDEIVQYVMEGSAYPAAQLISSYAPGYQPNVDRLPYNPELSRKLLAEAGFPEGFEANFDCPNNRYINDQDVAVAIAHQLSKIGLKINVIAQPKAVFFPKISRYESPMFMVGWGSVLWGPTMNSLFREKKGTYGRSNRGRYYNPEVEKLLDKANSEMDPDRQKKLRAEITKKVYAAHFVLPLYYQENVIGFSSRVVGKARADEMIMASDLKKAK